jgi:hypothetical protein
MTKTILRFTAIGVILTIAVLVATLLKQLQNP